MALWIAHTYAMQCWWISPIAALVSPTKRCGKTTLVELITGMVARALPASNISPAALFRVVERYQPTLLLDEFETYGRDSDELRGIVNAGHTRNTAVVVRCVGDTHEPTRFRTWCAKLVALIGKPADTILDRAIVVEMRRKTESESVERLRRDRLEAESGPLRRQLRRWVDDGAEILRTADPEVPEALNDRAADNWRPLLSLADLAGGDWPARAREAALILSATEDRDNEEAGVRLLVDSFGIFEQADGAEQLPSADLTKALVALEEAPWAEWSNGRPLTAAKLSRLLGRFGVHSTKLRIGAKTP